MRRLKRFLVIVALLLFGGFLFLFTYTPALSAKHGQLQTKLYLAKGMNQGLIVGFGGGSGGNDWARHYMKEKREQLHQLGFAVLAIGYFKTGGDTPESLDRIALDAIADTVFQIANRHAQINPEQIALIGGSKGGELILNLASRDPRFKAVIALSTSHVSFPATTITANTSSWSYRGKEVPYVPAPFRTLWPAIKGDLYSAFSIMLEDQVAVKQAEIEVEKINGPILLLSAADDEAWPATEMSSRILERLEENNFPYAYEHLILKGGHTAPLDHFDVVYSFLLDAFPSQQPAVPITKKPN